MRSLPFLLVAASLIAAPVLAQLVDADPDWAESATPPPPSYELARLVPFEVPGGGVLRFGVDPNTIAVTPDGLVRYVVVASSPTGAINAMYEAIRCSTGEFKTYARRTASSEWGLLSKPSWRSMQESQNTRYAFRLAQQGVCTGRAPGSSAAAIIRDLKSPRSVNQ